MSARRTLADGAAFCLRGLGTLIALPALALFIVSRGTVPPPDERP